jgi:hypothetical protein
MAENNVTVTTYQHGNAEIVVYRPTLTAEEEEKRNRQIVAALQQYGRAVFRNEMKRGARREPA